MAFSKPRRLQPWPEPPPPDALSLWAEAQVSAGSLELRYELSWEGAAPAPLGSVPPSGMRPPLRLDGLWQHTCFEAFVGVRGEDDYWELNVAPSGDWNVYRLAGYRQDLQPEPSLVALPFSRRLGQEGDRSWLQLSVRCPLPPALPLERPLELGLTAVVALSDGQLSYWALAHPAAQPDFHDRRGWRLAL